MSKYNVPVTEKHVTVYQVEARSGSDAAMKVGMFLAGGTDRADVKVVSTDMVARTVSQPARQESADLTIPGTV